MRKIMALVITMLFCTCVVAHGLTLEDYSGEWKATHVIMDGTEIAAWLAGLDMILEIDGTTAYLTSKAAVKDFQSANNLRVTGVADGKTQKVLFADSAKKKKVYQKLNYKAVSRDPDQHSGEFYGFSGKVIQVLEDGNKVQLRVATKDGYDDVVFVTYTRADGESRILEDDRVNVYGIYRGLISYESIFGEKITLPQFEAEQVRVK